MFSWFTRGRKAHSGFDNRFSEAQVRGLVDESPLAMAAVDSEGRMLAANTAYCALLGYEFESLRTMRVHEYIEPSDVEAYVTELSELLSGERERYRLESRYQRSDGSIVWAELSAQLVNGHEENERFGILALADVTQHREADAALRASSTEVALLAAASGILTRAVDRDTVMTDLLDVICEIGHWSVGICWTIDRPGGVLRPHYIWRDPALALTRFLARTERIGLAPGDELPGRVWQTGELGWVLDLEKDPSLRGMKASDDGLRTSFAFPILDAGNVACIIELFSSEPRVQTDMVARAALAISRQAGEALDRIQADHDLRLAEARYRTIAENSKDAIIIIDGESQILSVNRAAEVIFGYTRAELIGNSLTMLMPEEMRDAHRAGMRRYTTTRARRMQWDSLELPGVRKDGEQILLELCLTDISEGDTLMFTGFLRDITERKKEETALVYQALHDALTDLPNRTLLQERLTRAVLVSHRHSLPLALLFMDLDRFKDVNDTFGHHAGDVLLQQVAVRLQRALRESDTVARLGGDEFAVLLPTTDVEGAIQTAERLMETLDRKFELEGQQFDIGVSIGVALYPDHGGDAATLMRRADAAMYAAKRTGSGYAIYTPERDESNSLLLLTGELREAIESGQMVLHYQPKVTLPEGRADHVEALIRWMHPERGLTSPDGFVPLAEETGLVTPLTEWVLNESLRQHNLWREQGLDIHVAVNFSARVLHDRDLVSMVARTLKTWNVDSSRLSAEITESAIMLDPDRAKATLTELHKMGVTLSIDDFGTGYSSLAYLKNLPVDEIKIDKSFVMEMATNRDDVAIVRSVITLGHNFNLGVVAEGVDNKRTMDTLQQLGCDMAQGYYISRPLSASQLTNWLIQYPDHLSAAS